MPLDFLKRKGNADARAAAAALRRAGAHRTITLPEEVVAQEYQLKLYYAGKSSEGVRMKAGPKAIAELPSMLHGLAKSEIEVVEPLPIEFSQATPTIARPSEAMQWLNAHHVHSPVTRHALVVLESIDAIDLAFDTFVCTLLDGEVDTRGYPEYTAIVGGVASHWDEATGDMIVRAVVGWGGKGVRGDTDRIGAKLLGRHPHEHPRQPVRPRPDRRRAARAGRRPRRARLRPLRVRLGPRAGVLLPEVRHAPAPRLTAAPRRCRPTTTSARCGHRFEVIHGVNDDGPTACPVCGEGPMPQGVRGADDPLQGLRLGEEGPSARRPTSSRRSNGSGAERRTARTTASRRTRSGRVVRRRRLGIVDDEAGSGRRRPSPSSSKSATSRQASSPARRRSD